jgi:glutamyl-tRNA synthetase
LQKQGWEPEAVVNWLALAGWSRRKGATPAVEIEKSPSDTSGPVDVLTMDKLIQTVLAKILQ